MKTDQFLQLVKRYTDFSELTTPMLNEFMEKVIVHEGEGRGNNRRQRIDIYLNFIGAFEVPAHIVTPAEAEGRRQQEEQAEKEMRSKELAKARYEKSKQDRREFTARKSAGLLTPEEQEAEERWLAHNREWQKEWREKRKAGQPEKPRRKSLEELARLQKAGAAFSCPENLIYSQLHKTASYRFTYNANDYGIHSSIFHYVKSSISFWGMKCYNKAIDKSESERYIKYEQRTYNRDKQADFTSTHT